MKNALEKFSTFLHEKYGITPDILTSIRIFSAPWLALLISKILSGKSLKLAIITIILYALIFATYFIGKILTNIIPKTKGRSIKLPNMLESLSNKILIIFMLIPFGINLFTFFIILAESMLAFQVIYFPSEEKLVKDSIKKIKFILQIFLIPILILQAVTGFIPDMIFYAYIILTVVFTCIPAFSHYFYFEK